MFVISNGGVGQKTNYYISIFSCLANNINMPMMENIKRHPNVYTWHFFYYRFFDFAMILEKSALWGRFHAGNERYSNSDPHEDGRTSGHAETGKGYI